jgi:SPP1 gp7 family putative phage head morphogenesis protein
MKVRERFLAGRRVESEYARRLRQVAQHVGELVRGFFAQAPPTVGSTIVLRDMLDRYASLLTPWANSVAAKMANEVERRDAGAWAATGRALGRGLAREIASAPIGEALQKFMAEQVDLITSLPRKAAERVHKMALEGITEGERAESMAEAIMNTGHVTKSRANLIARTETARVASGLTMVRAKHVGSEGYIWRTALDSDVRSLHRRLEGKYIRWDNPPVAGENGETAHAGMIYNCRCYPEPVLPDVL